MAEKADVVATIVADCEQYWRTTRVPPEAVAEMKVELDAAFDELKPYLKV